LSIYSFGIPALTKPFTWYINQLDMISKRIYFARESSSNSPPVLDNMCICNISS